MSIADHRLQIARQMTKYVTKPPFPKSKRMSDLGNAKVLVVAIDDKEAATELVRHICESYPGVHVIARAYDRNHVYDLWHAGCRDIIREAYDGSIRMSRSVLEALGHTRDAATQAMAEIEAADRAMMVEMADLYEPGLSIAENDDLADKINARRADWEAELSARIKVVLGDEKAS